MSTRANFIIRFNNEFTVYYKHCDGYPEGLGQILKASAFLTSHSIPYRIDMKEYKKLFNAEDVNYYLRGLLENVEGIAREGSMTSETEVLQYLGGDIEYLYLIDINQNGIELSYTSTDWGRQEEGFKVLLSGNGIEL